MDRGLWDRELTFLHRNLRLYLRHWPAGHEAWSAVPGKAFTLLELASHLYTLPHSCAAILRRAPEDEIIRWQGGPWEATGPQDLQRLLDQGMQALKAELERLSDQNLIEKHVPWPFGEPMPPQDHVLALITHMYHHRGQFHLYLKQLGQPVDTESVFAS